MTNHSYMASDELADIGRSVMKEFGDLRHLDDKGCRIGYQWSSQGKKSKGMLVMADTEMVKDKFKAFMPYDFIITFYEPNCYGLDEVRMRRLMYHELKHVGYGGYGDYSIIPHDMEDFRSVVDKWGADWIRNE